VEVKSLPGDVHGPMAYDDLKEFEGETYTGMKVGGEHTWSYPNGLWHERKVAPDRWEFAFTSKKIRDRSAPVGSGVALDTQFHWYLLAHQWVRKIDADSYSTFMSGLKYKVAHKRPGWREWSSGFAGRISEREAVVAILEDALARIGGSREGPAEKAAFALTLAEVNP